MHSEVNRKESRHNTPRLLLVIVASLLVPAIAGCSPTTSSTTSPSSTNASQDDRDAGLFANKLRICVQNKAEKPIVLEWDLNMINTNNEYLPSDKLTKTLDVNQTDCAFTFDDFFVELGGFAIDGEWIRVQNDAIEGDAIFWQRDASGTKQILEPHVYKWIRFNGSTPPQTPYKLQGTANWVLSTYDKMTAYPVDFQVFYSP